MLVKYTYIASATLSQVVQDVKNLMISTNPDISALSASCDKGLSSLIINQSITNWTLHDDVPASNYFVVKSLNYDGSTYKYVQVIFSTSSIALRCFESWNATTHVGTAENMSSATTSITIANIPAVTAGGSIYLSVKRGLLHVTGSVLTNFNTLMEINRESPGQWDISHPCVVGMDQTSYIAHCGSPTSSKFYIGKFKRPDATTGDLAGSNGKAFNFNGMPTYVTGVSVSQIGGGASNADGLTRYMTTDFYFGVLYNGKIGPLGRPWEDFVVIPNASLTASVFDELTINGKVYVIAGKAADNSYLFILKE